MKKLFKIALSLVLALTLSASVLPFAACVDSKTTSGDEKNTPMTVEQWKQSIESTLSSSSYKLTAVCATVSYMDASDNNSTEKKIRLTYDSMQVSEYDFKNGIHHHNIENYFGVVEGVRVDTVSKREIYDKITPDNITEYEKTDDGDWNISKYADFTSYYLKLYLADAYLYPTTIDTIVYGNIIDFFEYFTYDEQNDSYTAELAAYDYDSETPSGNISAYTLSFKDGRLSKMVITSLYSEYLDMTIDITVTDYDKITVTIPDDVKNAVA